MTTDARHQITLKLTQNRIVNIRHHLNFHIFKTLEHKKFINSQIIVEVRLIVNVRLAYCR